MNKLLLIFLTFSFLFTQEPVLIDDTIEECPTCEECEVCPEPCEGQCLSDEVVQTLYVSIQELENDKESNGKIIENLNSQIYMYIQSDSLYQSQIVDYKKQLELKEEMIKLVKPKWYDNKWIWFGLGVAFTSGSVTLAGQLK